MAAQIQVFGPPTTPPHICKRNAPQRPMQCMSHSTTAFRHLPLLFDMAHPKLSHGGSILGFWPKTAPPLVLSNGNPNHHYHLIPYIHHASLIVPNHHLQWHPRDRTMVAQFKAFGSKQPYPTCIIEWQPKLPLPPCPHTYHTPSITSHHCFWWCTWNRAPAAQFRSLGPKPPSPTHIVNSHPLCHLPLPFATVLPKSSHSSSILLFIFPCYILLFLHSYFGLPFFVFITFVSNAFVCVA